MQTYRFFVRINPRRIARVRILEACPHGWFMAEYVNATDYPQPITRVIDGQFFVMAEDLIILPVTWGDKDDITITAEQKYCPVPAYA
jgi:hypothetical protein